MILDERTEFFTDLLIPQTATTTLMGDVIDLGTASRDIGNGQSIFWYVTLDIAAAGGTSATFALQSSAAAALTSPNTHILTPTYALATLTPAGKMLYMGALPLEGSLYLRYLGVICTTVGTFSGTGAVSSGLTFDPKGWKAYAKATS